MTFSITFIQILLWGLFLITPIISLLLATIVMLGLIVGRVEKWRTFDALYWAFITALTVGYGDIRPQHKPSKVLSVLIGILGIMLTGILVAITVKATSYTFEAHIHPETLEHISQKVSPKNNHP